MREIAAEFEAMGYEIPDSVYDLTPGYLNDLLGQAAVRDEKRSHAVDDPAETAATSPRTQPAL